MTGCGGIDCDTVGGTILTSLRRDDLQATIVVEPVLVFEDHPAAKKRLGDIYPPKLVDADIYISLFGSQYGNRIPKGELSPTKQEYEAATARGLSKWTYVFRNRKD